jgi:NAD(P)-dependent dehydrogenase (short-subunit alcohol dehydrogenase family)
MITTRTGKVAVVTGAASGIGRELAYGLGRRGCRLAVSDVDETGLAVTASTLRSSGVEVHAVRLDVADRAAVAGYASEVAEHFGVVHQLYNNAGVGLARHVTEMSYADFDRVLQINLWGVVHGTKEFLPHLIASGAGHLVNISSINGFLAQPGLSAYCVSKFAVRGFTETVRAEMIVDRHPVRVTVVHPGGVATNIATASLEHSRATGYPVTAADQRNTDFYNQRLLRASAASVAESILLGVARGRPRVIVGTHGRKVDLVSRLAPAWAPRWGAQLYRAMARR